MQLDRFLGTSVLSDKLLRDSNPSDYEQDVMRELGAEAVAAFGYALSSFQGLQRSSGEPAICHTADVAIRMADLAFPPIYIITALLHDCVEDTSSAPEDAMGGLAEIAARFGVRMRENVCLLTNRYQIIIQCAVRSLSDHHVSLRLDEESLARVAAEVRMLRRALSPDTRDALAHEFRRLAESLTHIDLGQAKETESVNRRYTLANEIQLQVYALFIDDMVDDFRERVTASEAMYDVVLVVKFMDAVDNLRTSAATERLKLEKILRKTQLILDKSFHLHQFIARLGKANPLFSCAYEYLKYTLMEQLRQRKHALQSLADTRFSPLSEFMLKEISSLQDKYKIDIHPPQRLAELRGEIRTLNGVHGP